MRRDAPDSLLWRMRCNGQFDFSPSCQDFPARRNYFPVLDHRESVDKALETLEKLSCGSASSIKFGRISLYFPCISGIRPQRPVARLLRPPPGSVPVGVGRAGDWLFPRRSLVHSRDPLRDDCVHRHPGSGYDELSLGLGDRARKVSDSAGCWRSTSFDPEPETARLRVYLGCFPRLSLSAISVVRFGAADVAKRAACKCASWSVAVRMN